MDIGVLLAFGAVVCTVLWFFTRKTTKLPPSPPGKPIIGHIGLFKPEETLKAFNKFHEELGDIFTIRILHKYTIIVSGYDNIREVLVGHADVTSDRPYSFVGGDILQNGGILGSSGSLWREHRTFSLASLRKFDFGKRSIEARISEEVEVFLSEVGKQNGKPFNIRMLTEISISNIVAYIVFGKRFEHTDPVFNSMIGNFDQAAKLISFQTPLNLFPSLQYIPGDIFNGVKVKKLLNKVFNNIQNFVNEHKETYDADNMRDYIDCYLQEQKKKEETGEKHTFSDLQLIYEAFNFFGAGTATTSATIRWAVLFIAHHPEVKIRMQQEIEDIVGSGRLPCLNDKPNLPFCEAVCYETLRRGIIAPFAPPHTVSRDIEVKGYTIPKGTILMMNLYSIQMDPKIFPEPEKFNPDRFMENGKCANHEKLSNFSMGKRVCLGEALAKMEIFLFITALVQRFDIQFEAGKAPPTLEPGFEALVAPQEYNICLVPRS